MDYSYNSDWNDFVRIECDKLRKKVAYSHCNGFIVSINKITYFNRGTFSIEKTQAECERNYQKYLSSTVKAQSEFEVKKHIKLAKAKLPEKAIKG